MTEISHDLEKSRPFQKRWLLWGSVVGIVLSAAIGIGVSVGYVRSKQTNSVPANNTVVALKYDNFSNPAALTIGQSLLTQFKLPGIAIAQSRGKRQASLVLGVRKYGTQVLITKNDTFHLGSITKSMTATLLATYISAGSLSWNMTISQALPELAASIHPGHRNTTLAMLTAQFSGIQADWTSNTSFLLEMYDPTLSAKALRLELTRRTLLLPPTTTPNTTFFYNNLNYVIIGTMIETRANSTWENLIQTRLFKPLRMNGCGFGPNPEISNISILNPWPHYPDKNNSDNPIPLEGIPFNQRDNPPPIFPAGGVHCPIDSFGRYLQLHLDGQSRHHTCSHLPKPFHQLTQSDFIFLHTPYNPLAKDSSGLAGNYTPGGFWRVNSTTIEHNGSNLWNTAHFYINFGLGITNNNTPKTSKHGIHKNETAPTNTKGYGFVLTNIGEGPRVVENRNSSTTLAVLSGVKLMELGTLSLVM